MCGKDSVKAGHFILSDIKSCYNFNIFFVAGSEFIVVQKLFIF